ncbi:MAG: hypothetical protein MUC87_21265 [Bacteroidia bacterium]|jgi:hypothetical protein|nr:hypothetical protein [Bacteroidia bacterium]
MKNKLIYFAIAAVSIIAFAFTTQSAGDLKSKLEHLNGTYADPAPYNYGKAWGKRIFTFENGKWTLDFTLSLDPEMKNQVFRFRTLGTYKIQNKSDKTIDTYNAVFYEEKKLLTLKTSDENLIKAFGFTPCNLTVDVEQDVSANGCSGWKSVKECPGDYDLLSMDKDGKLYFGNRPPDNDMCSEDKRPTSLTPPVVKSK